MIIYLPCDRQHQGMDHKGHLTHEYELQVMGLIMIIEL